MTYHICYDTDDNTYLIKREDNSYAWVDYLHIPEEWNYNSEYADFAEWFNAVPIVEHQRYLGSFTDLPTFIANHPEHFI